MVVGIFEEYKACIQQLLEHPEIPNTFTKSFFLNNIYHQIGQDISLHVDETDSDVDDVIDLTVEVTHYDEDASTTLATELCIEVPTDLFRAFKEDAERIVEPLRVMNGRGTGLVKWLDYLAEQNHHFLDYSFNDIGQTFHHAGEGDMIQVTTDAEWAYHQSLHRIDDTLPH